MGFTFSKKNLSFLFFYQTEVTIGFASIKQIIDKIIFCLFNNNKNFYNVIF